MILGIGSDLCAISRIEALKDRFGERFVTRILGQNELSLFEKAKNKSAFLAKRFSAKEAFAKALGTGVRGFCFKDIDSFSDALGAPFFQFSPHVMAIMQARFGASNLKVHLTMSDEAGMAQSFVIIENLA